VGKRTQRLGTVIEDHLKSRRIDADKAKDIARKVAEIFGKAKDASDKNPTFIKQLAFISPEERQKAIELADRLARNEAVTISADDILGKSDSAADIAMFGRMLADDPKFSREASVQVAHAFTTHSAAVEDDYYVAVDDLKDPAEREDAGTSFIGVQEFGAGLFYLYACADLSLLAENLGGDNDLARDSAASLVEAAALVAPRGKQASFASRARAQYVLAECGSQQPRSLAAAFLKPVTVREDSGDLLSASVKRIRNLRDGLDRAYGPAAQARKELYVGGDSVEGSLDEIVEFVRGCIA
jgi:CRISPR system Cascade subunit CasC